MRSKPSEITRGRRGERGAALVMSLLTAMLLLAAGGALIATTGMTVSNAVDATAEAQAYYAADAGLQAALTVLRRNRPSTSGTLAANFHNFACGTADVCVNDGNDLSQWLGTMPVSLQAGGGLRYEVMVRDPARPGNPADPGSTLQPDYHPRFLHVRSVGRGPRGAVKVMEMMVDDYAFDFTARAAVALHSHDTDTEPMSFTTGNSNPHTWNGNDQSNLAPGLPTFAVTNSKDYDFGDLPSGLGNGTLGIAEAAIKKDSANIVGPSQLAKLGPSDLEWWLKDANSARLFISMMRERAAELERLNPGKGDLGTDQTPLFSFVDGDLDMSGNSDSGAGLLIVTGKYSQKGSSKFHGIILALGRGDVERDGNPDIAGALVAAAFAHSWNGSAYTGNGGFTSPALNVSGGGNSFVGYNSNWVRRALEALGPRAVGVVEK